MRRPIGLTVPYREVGYQEQKNWIGLKWSDIPEKWVGNAAFMEGAKWAEKTLKDKNDRKN